MTEPAGRTTGKTRHLCRWAPVAVLGAGLVLFFAFDLDRFIKLETLHENREWLIDKVENNFLLAGLALIAIYAAVVAFSIPGGALLTVTAGFLFGTVPAASCVVVAATLGATGLFLAARTALGGILRAKAGPAIRRMEAGFRENALNYLLVLRLIPLFPFWLVNLVPALLGVSLRDYVIGTFFGIIPGTFVYASLGSGLGAILDAGKSPDLRIVFSPEILLPLVGIAVLALLPVVYKKIKARRASTG